MSWSSIKSVQLCMQTGRMLAWGLATLNLALSDEFHSSRVCISHAVRAFFNPYLQVCPLVTAKAGRKKNETHEPAADI